jgi:hypothetical protein
MGWIFIGNTNLAQPEIPMDSNVRKGCGLKKFWMEKPITKARTKKKSIRCVQT